MRVRKVQKIVGQREIDQREIIKNLVTHIMAVNHVKVKFQPNHVFS